jgi:spoIIIJ-associated protein
MATYKGETIEKAVQSGLADLDVSRSEVSIKTLVEPRRGFLGIGKRLAEINISIIEPQKSVMAKEPVISEPKKAEHSESEVHAKLNEVDDETKAEVHNQPKSATRPRLDDQVVAELQDYLSKIVAQLGIKATATNHFHHRDVQINFSTEQEGMLIGKHGRTINALQTLAQVFLLHHDIAHANVNLDVENYRERRTETLQHLAESTAREVVATGDPVFLDAMPAFERKVVHAALTNNHFVTTFSEGHEPHRYVVVALVQDEQL